MSSSDQVNSSGSSSGLSTCNRILTVYVGFVTAAFTILASYLAFILFIRTLGIEGVLWIVGPAVVVSLVIMLLCIRWLWHRVQKLEADVGVLKSEFPEPLVAIFEKTSIRIGMSSNANYDLYEERLGSQFHEAVTDYTKLNGLFRGKIKGWMTKIERFFN